MAWITPVTNHYPEEYFTHHDMNRIYGNLRYLYEQLAPYFSIGPFIPDPESTDTENLITSDGVELATASGDAIGATAAGVWWTQNDIYTIEDFDLLLQCLRAIADTIGYQYETAPSVEATAENFNVIESITLDMFDRVLLILQQFNGNHYVGDPIFTGEGIYLGGIYGGT